MTICDYHLTMISVTVARLKARLSEYLRMVREGRPVTVLNRDTPIARIVPLRERGGVLRILRPKPGATALRDVALPPPLPLDVDPVDLLLEDRESGR